MNAASMNSVRFAERWPSEQRPRFLETAPQLPQRYPTFWHTVLSVAFFLHAPQVRAEAGRTLLHGSQYLPGLVKLMSHVPVS